MAQPDSTSRPSDRPIEHRAVDAPRHRERDRVAAFLAIACVLVLLAQAAWLVALTRPGHAEPIDPAVRIHVNTADHATLQLLPGVGPVLAARMIAERANRPFADADDLQRVKGIGVKLSARMTPHIHFR